MEPSDDILDSLGDIRKRLSASICSTLLKIQKHQFSNAKSIEWISNLECLSLPPKVGQKRRYGDNGELIEIPPLKQVLRRRKINPWENFKERDYIAVSWVCSAEPGEDDAAGSYLIDSRGGGQQVRSKVRDAVLKRVIKYASHFDKKLFWIDQICINQANKDEKEVAIQSMDLVYSLSETSLAIINRHIGTENELHILIMLMKGRYLRDMKRRGFKINPNSHSVSPNKFSEALKLIEWLISTSWWMRAWTFQEDYKASVNMVLLISHHPCLEQLKRSEKIFGSVPGELCVKSTDFRTEVTKFCQAYLYKLRGDQENVKICKGILRRAGKYTISLREKDEGGDNVLRKPMAPTILADIVVRQITKPWDRLAIIANCCNYDI
jgi:hypothetical protein